QVVAVRILQTNHASAPGLILWRAIEFHADLAQSRVHAIDVGDCKADMIEPWRIFEQPELPTDRVWIRLPGGKQKESRVARCHQNTALVAICLAQSKQLVECYRTLQIGHADADVVESLHHLHSITSSASESRLSEMLTPSAFAVFMLITSSNLTTCCTGKSAGFAPLRGVDAILTICISDTHAVAQQSARNCIFAELVDGREPMLCCQSEDAIAPS